MIKNVIDIDSLEKKKGIPKRVKYVGLLFTGCQEIVEMPTKFDVKHIGDVEFNDYTFTDGCGIMSIKLAKKIVENSTELQKKWKGNRAIRMV